MTTFKIIACSTIRDEVEALRGDIPVEYLEGFLHDTPDVLRDTINERIAATPGDCTILLAYGRCSNGTAGLVAGAHRLVLPPATTASPCCWARGAPTCGSSPNTPAPTTTRAAGSRSSRTRTASTSR